MSGPEQALESGVLALLASDPAVRAFLGDPPRLNPPSGGLPAYPYLEIVAHDLKPAGGDGCIAYEHRLDLAIVVHRDLADAVRGMVAAVRAALDGARPETPGWRCVLLYAAFSDVLAGRRGRELRGLIRLRAILEPTPA